MGIVNGFEIRLTDQSAGDSGMDHLGARHLERQGVICGRAKGRSENEPEEGDKPPGRGTGRWKETGHGSPAGGKSCIWTTDALCRL